MYLFQRNFDTGESWFNCNWTGAGQRINISWFESSFRRTSVEVWSMGITGYLHMLVWCHWDGSGRKLGARWEVNKLNSHSFATGNRPAGGWNIAGWLNESRGMTATVNSDSKPSLLIDRWSIYPARFSLLCWRLRGSGRLTQQQSRFLLNRVRGRRERLNQTKWTINQHQQQQENE